MATHRFHVIVIEMPLTDAEYEDVYKKTLGCLADRHDVGEPFRRDGTRYCVVDGKELVDRGVLEAFWNPEIVLKILKDRSGHATAR